MKISINSPRDFVFTFLQRHFCYFEKIHDTWRQKWGWTLNCIVQPIQKPKSSETKFRKNNFTWVYRSSTPVSSTQKIHSFSTPKIRQFNTPVTSTHKNCQFNTKKASVQKNRQKWLYIFGCWTFFVLNWRFFVLNWEGLCWTEGYSLR